MKCHGSSTSRGIRNSLLATQKTIKQDIITHISNHLNKHNNIFENNKQSGIENTV